MTTRDSAEYRAGRRSAFLELRRLALAGIGSSPQADSAARALALLAEHCTIGVETATDGTESGSTK
jgi:hypothetical protein